MAKKKDLVQMHRELEPGKKGPTSADVHPDEVSNYAKAGWLPGKGQKVPKEAGPVADFAAINKMKKAKLEKYCEDNKIEIDLDEFSNMPERRAAVISILENK